MGSLPARKNGGPCLWPCALLAFTLFATASSENIMLCYYSPTSYCPVSDVPADLCTHLVYSFGRVTRNGIVPVHQSDPTEYRDLVALKKQNPKLKVLLSLQNGFDTVVVAGKMVMQNFSSSATKFLSGYGFDGVDLDWEYPSAQQKDNFMNFIEIFSALLKKENLLLSMALPNNPYSFKKGYAPQILSSIMDFMTVMAYDFHVFIAGRDTRTGYNSPLFTPKGEPKYLSTAAMIEYYEQEGLPSNKVLMGIPLYGRSWKLANISQHDLHSPAVGRGDPGPFRHFKGLYLYPDTCVAENQGAPLTFDSANGAAYLYTKNADWVAFDNSDTVNVKISYMKKRGLGGVGMWALHLDDVTDVCGAGRFSLLKTIKSLL